MTNKPSITKSATRWFEFRHGMFICGLDAIDLKETEAIGAHPPDEVDDGDEVQIDFYMRSGESFYVNHKYYAKYWDMEMAELFGCLAETRKRK